MPDQVISELLPRRVDAGRGATWIGEGWDLFKRSPGVWIAITLIGFVIMAVLSIAPVLSLISNLIGPVFIGGLMLGCRAQAEGGELKLEHLFEGFKGPLIGPLILLGVVSLVGVALIMLVMMMTVGASVMGAMMSGGHLHDVSVIGILLGMLLGLALLLPVAMALWFAPALVALRQVPPFEAVKLSFSGCLKNLLPFLVYGLLFLLIAIVASIPIFLGWLIAGPVLVASIYAGYRDIYLA